LYASILKEAGEEMHKSDFKAERHFLNHRDPQISLLTADLLTEPYELSKIHSRFQAIEKDEDKLDELIPHVLVDLKNAIILGREHQLKEKMKKAQLDRDEAEITKLTKNLMEILEIKKDLSRNLGERIVVR
jgi:DNA primase